MQAIKDAGFKGFIGSENSYIDWVDSLADFEDALAEFAKTDNYDIYYYLVLNLNYILLKEF